MAVPSSPIPESKTMDAQKTAKKRTTDPGVRVKGARVYDSQNGKTCHQCRQKTMDFTARCKNVKSEKQCTIMFCHKCLHNRYGENAEEMAVLEDWHCPKCRDICNCSLCMKKKGHKPTGIMVHTAKATGFTSVSQLLDVKGPNVVKKSVVKGKVSPKEPEGSTTTDIVSALMKQGKENYLKKTDQDEKNAMKIDQYELKEKVEIPHVDEVMSSPKKDDVVTVLRRSPRKFILPHESVQEKTNYDEKTKALGSSPRKPTVLQEVAQKEEKMDCQIGQAPVVPKKEKKLKVKAEGNPNKTKLMEEECVMDVDLPPGTELLNVSGIDLVSQDAGYALQFLEFCSSFGEILQLRKGQPECVLRDILAGRRRRGKSSSAVQFIMQLLSFMDEQSEQSEDLDESPPSSPTDREPSWEDSLKSYLSETELAPEDIPEGWFDKGGDRYDMLDSSQKLRLLTFLCDETLCTGKMRNWMEEHNAKFVEKGKEAKENLNAAKEKEKLAKRRLQEDVAKAVIAKNGAPLTIAEHESIVAEIKAESQRIHEEINIAMGLVSKKRQRSDAVRTEPIIIDDNGHAFWSLKGMAEASLVRQDMGAIQEISPNDKWSTFDEAEMKVVEKYMKSLRLKRHRADKLADELKPKRKSSPEVNLPAATNNCEAVVSVC